jgi:hypothetical protein
MVRLSRPALAKYLFDGKYECSNTCVLAPGEAVEPFQVRGSTNSCEPTGKLIRASPPGGLYNILQTDPTPQVGLNFS